MISIFRKFCPCKKRIIHKHTNNGLICEHVQCKFIYELTLDKNDIFYVEDIYFVDKDILIRNFHNYSMIESSTNKINTITYNNVYLDLDDLELIKLLI